MSLARVVGILSAAGLLFAGCGGPVERSRGGHNDAAPTTTIDASEPEYIVVPNHSPDAGWPNCRDVWVVGRALPDGYTGCVGVDEWQDEHGNPIPSRSTDSVLIPGEGLQCRDGGFLVRGWFQDGHIFTPTGTTIVGHLTIYFARLGEGIRSDIYAPNSHEDAAFEAAIADCRG